MNLAAIGIDVARHALSDQRGLERIEANILLAELVNGRLHGAGKGVERAFAHAGQSLVGFHESKQAVLPWVAGNHRGDLGYLHRMSSPLVVDQDTLAGNGGNGT